ncbi:helix-turn-helix transcriptional regulator [Teredinibacter haidensis]|uniref:helix-turn-helix transcriptional regulator n=1 Tax=Teredinibacter haidensis TaxID=2731755 RepID=UPI000948BFFA|nr:WYL domain-containing protein [Teredinibacter haidensis]
MDKFDRFQQLHRIFKSHKRPVAITKISEKLECTEGNAKRLVHQLRDYWQAPLEYSGEQKGWYYNLKQGEKFELPGLWLTADELQSLIALLNVLRTMNQGLVSEELGVVEQSIEKLLAARGIAAAEFGQCIKYLPLAKRQTQPAIFNTVADALIHRKQLHMVYRDYKNRQTTRTLSPQTLVYYRENWQLDAWCHLRQGLRTFSISRIEVIEKRKGKAKNIPQQQLSQHFASSYGIFAGKAKYAAKLRFYPEVAREIASQQWHPQQTGEWEGKNYLLTLPYSQDAELVMDILRYGNNVEVLEPTALRKRVRDKLAAALRFY